MDILTANWRLTSRLDAILGLRYFWWFLPILLGLNSCAVFPSKALRNARQIRQEVLESEPFSRAASGFVLIDAETGQKLVGVLENQLFTPASNTKILTLATCLELLGDSLVGLKIARTNDQRWIIRGTGDPTFLHPDYQVWQPAFQWIREQQDPILLERQMVPRFGPGWAWDDYLDAYSAERSDFPFYGNVALIQRQGNQWRTLPENLPLLNHTPENELYPPTGGIFRLEHLPYFIPGKPDTTYQDGFEDRVPFSEMSLEEGFLLRYLPDTLGKTFDQVCYRNFPGSCEADVAGPWYLLYSVPADTVLRQMMFESDNLLAEQLLLNCSDRVFDQLKSEWVIDTMLKRSFAGLTPKPRWVDGSGLSRYNLISPTALVAVLRFMWMQHPKDQILSYFPSPGASGTLSEWPRGPKGEVYYYGKTGSMSGVMCMSGYVRGKSGRMMIFSFMHNNFIGTNSPLKAEMQRILALIHAKY
jgi:serine-type D-Ala-D-Ala carboxypeptidase/endopeptidase (penicillin-binding protein 4)